jgi:hypothetical protein
MRSAVAAVALALLWAAPAAAAPELVPIGEFDDPVHVASPPNDPRVFVVEQGGLVKQVGGGTFLDVRHLTTGGGERGLLSIAFAPDFATSGRYYVFLTAAADGSLRVLEFPSGRALLSIPHPRGNHNGGQLQFGPDGMLYAGTGDGGGANDPDSNAQNPGSLLGKILRIDPASGSVQVWALGLRNPWRFSFDRATGDLLIGDVGQVAWEEVDVVPNRAGLNFGWPCLEGTHDNPAVTCTAPADAVPPVFERSHEPDGFCAITGGYVVRDPGLPTLAGRYLYGDLCLPALRSTTLAGGGDRAEPLAVSRATSFGEDACGRLYVASLDGPVYRIQDGAPSPCALPAPPPTGGPPPRPGPGDAVAPRLSVHTRGLATAARRRRIVLRVRCDEACRVTAGGRLRGVGPLRTASRDLPAGDRTAVRVRFSRATARRLRAALRRRPRVVAAIAVRASDAAGNERALARRARIRR